MADVAEIRKPHSVVYIGFKVYINTKILQMNKDISSKRQTRAKDVFLIILGKISFITPYLFADLEEEENVTICHGNLKIENKFLYKLYQYCQNSILSKHSSMLWNNKAFSFVENYHYRNDVNYYVVITDYGTEGLDFKRLEKLKKGNIKFILLFLNPLSRNKTQFAFEHRQFFDFVITFDPEDASQNGFVYWPQVYSRIKPIGENCSNLGIAYFVGYDKGRGKLLNDIAEKLTVLGVECEFNVLRGSQTNSDYSCLNYIASVLPYERVLDDVCKASILIDIVQPGQTGVSMRYAESVCYNKVLITNNHSITGLPFYNSKHMHIIDSADDIDPSWTILDEKPDYNYNGEFSPVHLIDWIRNQVANSLQASQE